MKIQNPIAGALGAAILVLICASGAMAADSFEKRFSQGEGDRVYGGSISAAKAAVTDTVLLMGPWGSGALENGQFQTPEGAPAWNGWTSVDLTQPTVSYWHADTYQPLSGGWSAWCGQSDFPACGEDDVDGGYGNNYDEVLEWRGTVDSIAASTNVDISALVQARTEPGYDYCWITIVKESGPVDIWSRDGINAPESLDLQALYEPYSYAGENGDEVVIQFRVTSDGGWSDADCSFPADGAFLLDDLAISTDNGPGYSHDFEDGTLGELQTVLPSGVGDFAKVWDGLQTPNACGAQNVSPMAAFIDDGEVVPGTGGTLCLTKCYGPGGFVVNYTGGLAGPEEHIHNAIESPVMPWPGPDHEGGLLEFDVWRDMLLGSNDPGIFFTWSVRSTTDPDPAAIQTADWKDRNFVYYGGPDWVRFFEPVGDLIPADAQWVQIQLAVYEIGFVWGFVGEDSSPAPYFDNVRLAAFPYHGPALSATVNALPHDAFPESGGLDLENPGANHIRFDSGQDISDYWDDTSNDIGDSIVIQVEPMRAGAELVGMPRLQWSLQRNPVFDAYRSSGLPDRGSIDGWEIPERPGSFAFDLPDTGFLFPGDFLYYYFEATDEVGGVAQTATLPADTTGFSNFDDPMAYPPIYKLHALPSVREESAGVYTQPGVLFYDDSGAEGNRDEWYSSFANLGMIAGVDYDIYYTNNPRVGTGQGLGGRATAAQLAGYGDLIYTSNRLSSNTLSDGTVNGDPTQDVQVLSAWLEQGGKDLFLTGDDLAGDLARASSLTAGFLADWVGVDLVDENVLALIDMQTSPLVLAEAGNPVLDTVQQWLGVARCASFTSGYYGSGGSTATGQKRYDGVETRVGAIRLAEFSDPLGNGDAYTFSAATLYERADFQSRVISLPYSFEGVWTDDGDPAKAAATLAARTRLLGDVLSYFGAASGSGAASPVPSAGAFSTGLYPNPFNPVTNIQWNLPRSGHLSVQVYDLHGRLVRTLVDEVTAEGPGQVQWDGRGEGGRAKAAGVYFYRVRSGDETQVGKMSLIK